jgi:hypothetical protein
METRKMQPTTYFALMADLQRRSVCWSYFSELAISDVAKLVAVTDLLRHTRVRLGTKRRPECDLSVRGSISVVV